MIRVMKEPAVMQWIERFGQGLKLRHARLSVNSR